MRRAASEVIRELEQRVARLERKASSTRKASNTEVVSTIQNLLRMGSLNGYHPAFGSALVLCQRLFEHKDVSAKTKKALAGVLKIMTSQERHRAYGIKFNVRTRATSEMFEVLNGLIEKGDHAKLLKTIQRPDYASALGEVAVERYEEVALKLKKLKAKDRKVFEILREELQLHQGNLSYAGKVQIINEQLMWRVVRTIKTFNKVDYLGGQIFPNAFMSADTTNSGLVVTFKASKFIEDLLRRERYYIERGGDPSKILKNERKVPITLDLLAKRIEERVPGFLKIVEDFGYKMEENLGVERREIIQTYREDPSWGENEYDREFEEGDLEAKWKVPYSEGIVNALYELALTL
jgi:hypothetical protein